MTEPLDSISGDIQVGPHFDHPSPSHKRSLQSATASGVISTLDAVCKSVRNKNASLARVGPPSLEAGADTSLLPPPRQRRFLSIVVRRESAFRHCARWSWSGKNA